MNQNNEVQDVQPKEPEKEVNLTFKLSEVNTILASLDEMPHKFSRRIVDSIIQQSQAQLK
mgnify:CR=1 FL=1